MIENLDNLYLDELPNKVYNFKEAKRHFDKVKLKERVLGKGKK